MTKRQEQALATKNKIIHCAIDLFATNTFETITVKDICQAAEVSIGAFYHHFTSKADILDQAYQFFDDEIKKILEENQPDKPLEAIKLLISKQNSSLNQIGLQASLQLFKNQLTYGNRYILNKDRFFYQEMLKNIKKSLDLGILKGDADTITAELLSTSRGIAYDWCLNEGAYSLEDRTLKVTDMILDYYKDNKGME